MRPEGKRCAASKVMPTQINSAGGLIKFAAHWPETPRPRSVRNLDEIAKFLKSAPLMDPSPRNNKPPLELTAVEPKQRPPNWRYTVLPEPREPGEAPRAYLERHPGLLFPFECET
jgi:hypothetical protein